MKRSAPVLPDSFVQSFEKVDPYQAALHLQSEYGLLSHVVEWDRHQELAPYMSKEDIALLGLYEERVNGEMKHLHSLRLSSFDKDRERDEEEIAQITITNGLTGKEYVMSVWANDLENDKLQPYYVYLNQPLHDQINIQEQFIDKDMVSSGAVWEGMINERVSDVQLFDLIQPNEEIEQTLLNYHQGRIDEFKIDLPQDQLAMDLHDIMVNEELTEVMLKANDGFLEKDDLVSLGKNLRGFYHLDLNIPYQEDLKGAFQDALEIAKVEDDELPFVKETFGAFGVQSEDIASIHRSKSISTFELADDLER
ncbi:hypothetical protein [Ammoniphilus oxalaticus]|nr:hypothetical protein [Ammoniphilus oxalaticus]